MMTQYLLHTLKQSSSRYSIGPMMNRSVSSSINSNRNILISTRRSTMTRNLLLRMTSQSLIKMPKSLDTKANPFFAQTRTIWSTGTEPNISKSALTPQEIIQASSIVKKKFESEVKHLRFICITLDEAATDKSKDDGSNVRFAEILVLNSKSGLATEMQIDLKASSITSYDDLPRGIQPMLIPEDCDLAEAIVKQSEEVQQVLQDRYGITDMSKIAADPWSVHLADESDRKMTDTPSSSSSLPPRRLVQTFLYQRMYGEEMEDNHYAHPIDILPVVDLNTKTVVCIDGLLERTPPPKIPEASANYHRNLIHTNSYLSTTWRQDVLKTLNITQPDGPSFHVTDGNWVKWQNWSFRVGFNYREGLVLHDVRFDDRSILNRASLVEMAVPYGDSNPPFQRKCAFDVGDYGLGYCANSLELGCDCLGHIHYFDALLNDVDGQPKLIKKAICMHEEDDGLLWKHVEYRNGHNEARRSRELVVSSIATVVNYEYLFYWRFKLDGSIDFEIRLSGELSTNLPSALEDPMQPKYGTLVAPGVNSQIHQHMFCSRLDMAVDGTKNTVSEIDIVSEPISDTNPYGNAFYPKETILKHEQDAVRTCDASKARLWKISNAEGKVNAINKKPVSYKLIPFTRGAAQPVLFTHPESAVSKKGNFASAHLWVTKNNHKERYPAGEYTPQLKEIDGLPTWIQSNRQIEEEDIVLWHSYGVTHIPRVEDFPVMPCESTGFTLKPDGFFGGNPAIDIPPETNSKSKLDGTCCNE